MADHNALQSLAETAGLQFSAVVRAGAIDAPRSVSDLQLALRKAALGVIAPLGTPELFVIHRGLAALTLDLTVPATTIGDAVRNAVVAHIVRENADVLSRECALQFEGKLLREIVQIIDEAFFVFRIGGPQTLMVHDMPGETHFDLQHGVKPDNLEQFAFRLGTFRDTLRDKVAPSNAPEAHSDTVASILKLADRFSALIDLYQTDPAWFERTLDRDLSKIITANKIG